MMGRKKATGVITMQIAAKRIGLSYRTLARWIENGFVRPKSHKGQRGLLVTLGNKELRELRQLAQLRGILSMQQLRRAIRFLREDLKHNPLSTGRFFVIAGAPGRRRLIKICDTGAAIELVGESRGQLVMVPLLFDEIESAKES